MPDERIERSMWQQLIEQDGFAIILELFSREDVLQLLGVVTRTHLRRSRAGVRHLLSDPAVAAWANNSRLLAFAQSILGTEAFPYRATLFDKSAAANWLVAWHQDTALPLRERRELSGWGSWSMKEGVIYAHAPASALARILALRVHLDDSTAQNGPLRVLPGTHKLGVLSDEKIRQLALEISPVGCIVAQGGVLAMKPLLVHSSSKTQTNSSRRILHIEYATTRIVDDGMELAIA